jgi:hypothetical protein
MLLLLPVSPKPDGPSLQSTEIHPARGRGILRNLAFNRAFHGQARAVMLESSTDAGATADPSVPRIGFTGIGRVADSG